MPTDDPFAKLQAVAIETETAIKKFRIVLQEAGYSEGTADLLALAAVAYGHTDAEAYAALLTEKTTPKAPT